MSTCDAHHYRIAEQDGSPKLKGTCKKCGHERMFFAAEQERDFGRTKARRAAQRGVTKSRQTRLDRKARTL